VILSENLNIVINLRTKRYFEFQDSNPNIFKQALKSENKKWLKAENEEMCSSEKKQTWKLVELSNKQQIVGCKLIFKNKKVILGIELTKVKNLA